MQRILVTGGAGFIGSHTADLLLQKGYEVRILDNLAPPVHITGQWPSYVPAGVERVLGDVRDKASWETNLVDVDAVIHLAAYQDYLPDFSRFFHVNSVGTALLYEVIVEKRLPVRKVVVASSQATYGEARYECPNGSCPLTIETGSQTRYPPLRSEAQLKRAQWSIQCPVCGEWLTPVWTDESVVNPHNQYSVSKYTQELIALNLGQRYGIPTVALRYSIVQGSRQSFRNAYSGVLRIFSQRLLSGRPPICYEDGQQIRDYVSVRDVARANLLVLEDDRANYGVYNVGGDRQVTVIDYARLIARRTGVAIEPTVPGLYRFGDTRHVFSNVRKLRSLGWRASVSLTEIVDEYLAWAQSQPDFRDYYDDAQRIMLQQGTLRTVAS